MNTSKYVPIPEGLLQKDTPDQKWLREQTDRIDPWIWEQGNDGAYTRALERLAFELRDKLAAAGLS